MLATAQQQCLNIPTEFSSGAQWKQWHISLVSCVGKDAANSLWIQLWDVKGRTSTNAYDTSLAQYMIGQGVALEESGGEQVARNMSDLANWIGGGFKFSRGVSFVLVGGVSIAFIILLFNLIVKPEKAAKTISVIGDAAMLGTPTGRVLGGGSKMLQR